MQVRIDPLDKLFSEYVRKRCGGCCERCGKHYGWKGLQTSHYHGRAKRSTRYDEDNAMGLCFGCHQYFGSNPLEHTEFMIKRLGQEKFDELSHRARQIVKIDRNAITLYYKSKIEAEELKKYWEV